MFLNPRQFLDEPWQLAIELVVIWLCVFFVFRFLRGTRGAGVINGFAVLLLVGAVLVTVFAQTSVAFSRLAFLSQGIIELLAILLIVVFQPELRQALVRLGRAWSFRGARSSMRTTVDAVSEAVTFLSKSEFGALIAIERSSQLGGLAESGAQLDARVDARLLESIFWPSNPLHDLGVVIRDDRIVAASVQFPLAEEGVLPVGVGSRHRAAAGLSQESDCLVVVVSEETGGVSLAEHGRLERDVPRDRLAEILMRRLQIDEAPEPEAPAAPEPVLASADDDHDPDERQAA